MVHLPKAPQHRKGKRGPSMDAQAHYAAKMIAFLDHVDFTKPTTGTEQASERALKYLDDLRRKTGEALYERAKATLGDADLGTKNAVSKLIGALRDALGLAPTHRGDSQSTRRAKHKTVARTRARAIIEAKRAAAKALEQAPVPQEAPRLSKPVWAPAVDDEVIYSSPSGEVEAVVTAFKPGFVRLRGPSCSAMWIPVAHVRLSE